MLKNLFFNIDVVGSCNLKCPTCPTGNWREKTLEAGMMKPELLKEIMDKATREANVIGVGLFNWTEPLIHPNLDELIRIVQSYGVGCSLSSNLNVMKNIDRILLANPASFRVSTSGFTQVTYAVTHRGGNIERVKQNMVELAEARRRNNATTEIHVLFHVYRGNLVDAARMKKYAVSLGFGFKPVWAFMMPVEKVLAYLDTDGPQYANLSSEDLDMIDQLALPLREASEVAKKHKQNPCGLLENQVTLDYKGDAQLCCSTFDYSKFNMGNYLAMSLEELQGRRYKEKICGSCMHHGVHVYFAYGAPEFHQLAISNIFKRNLDAINEVVGA